MSRRNHIEHDTTELIPIRNHFGHSDPLLEYEVDLGGRSDRFTRHGKPRNKTGRYMFRVRGRLFEGWKFTIFLSFVTSLVVLFFNAGFLFYCIKNPKSEPVDSYPPEYQDAYREQLAHQISSILYMGDCTEVEYLGIGFHLLINVLSTALLSASNFGMQCLAAPTRKNIDQAHRKNQWLDIGVPSIHNLFRISGIRRCLWLLLAISSLPFHLLYNSAVYSTTSSTAYEIFAGPDSLGQKSFSNLNLNYPDSIPEESYSFFNSSFQQLYDAAGNGSLNRLENAACIGAFAKTFQGAFNRLLLVTNDIPGNETYVVVGSNDAFDPKNGISSNSDPYPWMCETDADQGSQTDSDAVKDICKRTVAPNIRTRASGSHWAVTVGYGNLTHLQVQYCMAEIQTQHCKLQYSFPLTMLAIAFNLVKTGVLLYMWLGIPDAPILTIGDAIASFLHHPDSSSENGGLLTSREVRSMRKSLSKNLIRKPLHQPRAFEDRRRHWYSAVSGRRWGYTIFLWILGVAVCLGLLGYGLGQIGGGSNVWTLSLGSSSPQTLISSDYWPTTLVPNVMIANSPQVIFSFLYVAFNGTLTAMTLAAEWSGFVNQRKGLRVSHRPRGSQRTNYFLSIPYRYSIPLLVVSPVLHWLISQSLYMVGVEAYDSNQKRTPASDYIGCAWSPKGIVGSVSVGVVMFAGLLILACRRFESAMPVASSCSLAIAAACHPKFDPSLHRKVDDRGAREDMESENEDEDMSLLPVQWGAVRVNGLIGHCSFTSGDVEIPQPGDLYQ